MHFLSSTAVRCLILQLQSSEIRGMATRHVMQPRTLSSQAHYYHIGQTKGSFIPNSVMGDHHVNIISGEEIQKLGHDVM